MSTSITNIHFKVLNLFKGGTSSHASLSVKNNVHFLTITKEKENIKCSYNIYYIYCAKRIEIDTLFSFGYRCQ